MGLLGKSNQGNKIIVIQLGKVFECCYIHSPHSQHIYVLLS